MMCMHMCTGVYATYVCPRRSDKGIASPSARVVSSWEFPKVGARIQTQVL